MNVLVNVEQTKGNTKDLRTTKLVVVVTFPVPDVIVVVAYGPVLHGQPLHHPHCLKDPILHHELRPQS